MDAQSRTDCRCYPAGADVTTAPYRQWPEAQNQLEVLIHIESLGKTYLTVSGDEVVALTDIHLVVHDKEFVSVVGPSGCGKSTLLKILSGLVSPSTGRVRLDGAEVTGPRRDIGMVFQNPVLLPWLTVLENCLLPARVQGLDRQASVERASHLIALVGLKGFEDKYPAELSGGMQQRNAIVRSLVHDPRILLMDEPFGALDAMTRDVMNAELQRIWLEQQKTVVFVTHSIQEAVLLSDRVVVLSRRPGRLLDVISVPFGRPRGLEVVNTEMFGQIVGRIRSVLATEGVQE